jgi:hypothetical protein
MLRFRINIHDQDGIVVFPPGRIERGDKGQLFPRALRRETRLR